MKRLILGATVAVAMFFMSTSVYAHPRVVVVPSYGGGFYPAPVHMYAPPVYGRPVYMAPPPVAYRPHYSHYSGVYVNPGVSSFGLSVTPGYGFSFGYSNFAPQPFYGYPGVYRGW